MKDRELLQRSLAELMGTFFLVFAGAGAIIANSMSNGIVGHIGVSITFGLIVMAMIYAIGDISGAHINPAVSFAFWVSKKMKGKEMLFYVMAQFIGAALASISLLFFFPNAQVFGETLPKIGIIRTFIFEIILSYLLMFVIVHVSTGSKEKGLLAGVAVGGTVLMEAMFAGPFTGASMNPARSFGPALVSGNLAIFWIYLCAPILGMWLAVLSCKMLRNDCCKVEE